MIAFIFLYVPVWCLRYEVRRRVSWASLSRLVRVGTRQYVQIKSRSICQIHWPFQPATIGSLSLSLRPPPPQPLLIISHCSQGGQGSGSSRAPERGDGQRKGKRGMESKGSGGEIFYSFAGELWQVPPTPPLFKAWWTRALPGVGQFPPACLGGCWESRGLISPHRNTYTLWLTDSWACVRSGLGV